MSSQVHRVTSLQGDLSLALRALHGAISSALQFLHCLVPDTAFVLCSRHRHQDKMTSNKVDAKVVLLGKSFAGKTCLVERYLKNRFMGDTVPYQNV